MRFLADENVSRLVVERLRADGVDVISVGETSPGLSDDGVLALANAEGRILITEDRDLGELVVRQQRDARGVILLELDRLSNAAEADLVARVVSGRADRLAGNLIVVEPGRIRVRPLARGEQVEKK